jgi:inosine-uridine nucleoside N-ribohydrolase
MPSVPERPRIILDCDPGHDDAIAIVVAAAHTEIVGVTTVAGNAPLSSTTHNALVVLDLLHRADIEVHSGADRPLLAPPRHAEYVHGESGLDGADLAPPSRSATSPDAVEFIVERVRAEEGLWLVPTGPLTNIGLALRAAPDIARRLAGISLMGGGRFGNRTAAAEFNIWADPEAAAIVFDYGGPLIMAGLHVTHGLRATPPRIAAVRSIGGLLASTLADLLEFFTEGYVRRYDNMDGAAVHDPCAVLALTHRDLFTRTAAHVVVETGGEHTRGMTVIDDRRLVDRPAPTCEVLETIDDAAAFDVIVGAIAACGAIKIG